MWLFDAVSKVCESTEAGNQGDQPTTAEMQAVDLSHYLINNSGWQRHVGTHQPQSIPVPTGTQGHRLLQAQLIPALCVCVRLCLPHCIKGFMAVHFITRLCFYGLWAFGFSLSLSIRRPKSVCECVLSLHRNSTSEDRERMNNTRHSNWGFPTLAFLAFSAARSLEWIYLFDILVLSTLSSQHKVLFCVSRLDLPFLWRPGPLWLRKALEFRNHTRAGRSLDLAEFVWPGS